MRANNFKDMTGMRFGRLTVISLSHIDEKRLAVWRCKCDCGKEKLVRGSMLRCGNTSSCGCLSVEISTEHIVKLSTTHGKTHTRLFGVWCSMKNRCHNQNDPNYGGRGINVCPEWEKNFESFYTWAMENGYDPLAKFGESTIDRIDNNRGYSPENCRITNASQQANNRRSTNLITYRGTTRTTTEWAKYFGKSRSWVSKMTEDQRTEVFDAYERYKSEHGSYPKYLSKNYIRREP